MTFCTNEEASDPGKQQNNHVRVERLAAMQPFGLCREEEAGRIMYGPEHAAARVEVVNTVGWSNPLPRGPNPLLTLPNPTTPSPVLKYAAPRSIVIDAPPLQPNTRYCIFACTLGSTHGDDGTVDDPVDQFDSPLCIVTNRSCFRNPWWVSFETEMAGAEDFRAAST